MPPPPASENLLGLIHGLRDEPENKDVSLKNLVDLLRKSHVDEASVRLLKSETPSLIRENVNRSDLLRRFSTTRLAEREKEYQVVRREAPSPSLRMPGERYVLGALAQPARTLGPFRSEDGRLFWFDFFKYEKLVKVYLSGDARPLMFIPVKSNILTSSSQEYTLAKGSCWIRADLFSPQAGAASYTGFRIAGGKVAFSQSQQIEGDKMTLSAAAGFDLDLSFDNTYEPAGKAKHGADARSAQMVPPKGVTLRYAAQKLSITALGNSSWKLYGDSRNFDWLANKAVAFNKSINRIVVPLKTDVQDFKVRRCDSTFFRLEGEANVSSAAWCLAVAELNTENPFPVKNNGALALICDAGLKCSWLGIGKDGQSVQLNKPMLMLEPGSVFLYEYSADFKLITENYKLWIKPGEKSIRTELNLSFLAKKKLEYLCSAEGTEGISATADADFLTDRPLRADGVPVAPESKDSLYMKYVSPVQDYMIVLDQDLLAEGSATSLGPAAASATVSAFATASDSGAVTGLAAPPGRNLISTARFRAFKKTREDYQFAIRNAYFLTTPPAGLMLLGVFGEQNLLVTGNMMVLYGLLELIPTLPHPYTAKISFHRRSPGAMYRSVATYNDRIQGLLASLCSWETAKAAGQPLEVDFRLLHNQPQTLSAFPSEGTGTTTAGASREDVASASEFASLMYAENAMHTSRASAVGNRGDVFALLDLSTNYDLLGVAMSFNQVGVVMERLANILENGPQVVTIEKMSLRSPMALLNGFTLPHISWEPFLNTTPPGVSQDPPGGLLGYPDNGPATVFSQLDTTVINIDPLEYLQRFRNNLKPAEETLNGDEVIDPDEAEKLQSKIQFGLPNGKVSIAHLSPFISEQATVNSRHLDFIRPEFALRQSLKLKGGVQLRISANKPPNEELPPELKGITHQLQNITNASGTPINKSVLGNTVHAIFNTVFASGISNTGVPLTHIDFSGYGASMFSNWLKPLAKFADVAQVRFDVMIGRVSQEIVQAVSMVYPWGITVVRTITLYRRNNAIIYREDSGWVAKSDGLFDFSFRAKKNSAGNVGDFRNPYVFHPGLIGGLFNVQNIKEIESDFIDIDYTPSNGDYFMNGPDDYVHDSGVGNPVNARLIGVSFDADVVMEDISGGAKNGFVTGRQFKGYLQVTPSGVPISEAAFSELMQRNQDSIGGRVDCTMKLGGSLQTLKINRVDVSASFQNNSPADIIFVVAAKGSVQLPADGSWSVVELDRESGEVQPVADKQSVPVIRKGERDRDVPRFQLIGKSAVSQVAFPDALLNNVGTFSRRYGYVQNTGTQKLLLADPRYDRNVPEALKTDAPLLADSFRLLNSKGPFPNLENALQIENVAESVTKIVSEGLSKAINNFQIPDHFTFDIIGKEGDPFRMYVQYKSETKNGQKSGTLVDYITDSAAGGDKWKNELNNMSIVVDLASFKPLMTISGNIKTGASVKPGFDSGNAPQLKLAEPLEKIYEILEFLDNLDPSQPVEAVKKGLKIAMSNTADSWEYKFKADKEIPLVKFPFDPINYNSPTTPLKLDAYFRIGCYFNQPIKIPKTIDQIVPSAGAFLELGADLRVMCVSIAAATVYATGRAEVGLAADLKNPPTLYFKFGFGVELAVGLPVIGSVAVMYMVGVDMSLNTQVLIVGAFIYFRGRAEIFGGIVTVTIQIEAAGKIEKQLGGPTSCIAMCTFALDISIFWVIDISFSETWQESRQIA